MKYSMEKMNDMTEKEKAKAFDYLAGHLYIASGLVELHIERGSPLCEWWNGMTTRDDEAVAYFHDNAEVQEYCLSKRAKQK